MFVTETGQASLDSAGSLSPGAGSAQHRLNMSVDSQGLSVSAAHASILELVCLECRMVKEQLEAPPDPVFR